MTRGLHWFRNDLRLRDNTALNALAMRVDEWLPASNNGGWQWAASTGTDAQPYFRIFNPVAQGRRWDPEGPYVRRWVPELRAVPGAHVQAPWESGQPGDYPPPVVDHAERRALALDRFRRARARIEPSKR